MQTRNALSGTYSAPQRSASSAALLVGDPTVMRDRAGNFVLPRADVMKLRDRLRNEELAAGSILSRIRNGRTLRHDSTTDVGHRREMCAHARILALEEAIDTEWVYMWDKFGGYLLLLLGLTAKAERVQVIINPTHCIACSHIHTHPQIFYLYRDWHTSFAERMFCEKAEG